MMRLIWKPALGIGMVPSVAFFQAFELVLRDVLGVESRDVLSTLSVWFRLLYRMGQGS